MAMPNSALQARNSLYVLQNPVPSSSTMNRRLFTTKGHLRPYRSAAMPVPLRQLKNPYPLSLPASRTLTKYYSAYRSEHQDQGNAPGDLTRLLPKLLGQLRHGQGDSEEIKGIPGPGNEGDEEEQPLLRVQQRQELKWVRGFRHGGFEGRQAGCKVAADGHVLVRHCVVAVVVNGGRMVAWRVAVVRGHSEKVALRSWCWTRERLEAWGERVIFILCQMVSSDLITCGDKGRCCRLGMRIG